MKNGQEQGEKVRHRGGGMEDMVKSIDLLFLALADILRCREDERASGQNRSGEGGWRRPSKERNVHEECWSSDGKGTEAGAAQYTIR